MNLLIALLFSKTVTRTIKRTANPKHLRRGIRREVKFWVQLTTEIVQALQRLFKFISSIVKRFRKVKAEEAKTPENVINFTDYKLKKAN